MTLDSANSPLWAREWTICYSKVTQDQGSQSVPSMDPRTMQYKQQKVEWGLSLNWAFHSTYPSTVPGRLSGRVVLGFRVAGFGSVEVV